MKKQYIYLQCVSFFCFLNPTAANAIEWDYKDIILHKETLELTSSQKAINIDAGNNSSINLYDTSTTRNTVLNNKSKENVYDNASTYYTIVNGDGSRQYGYGDRKSVV